MLATEVARAITATTALSSELGLLVSEARIVGNSNKLGLRLLPCDVFARVAFSGQEAFQFEIEIARRLAEIGSPVASLDTRVEPRVFERDGFALTLWQHYEQPGIDPSAASYAKALEGLHAGMAQLDIVAPHFSDRVSEAQRLLRSFIDFETCCRGPVEFDLAHVRKAVCEAYSAADPELIQESRRLVLAMVAAWRWDIDDRFPSGARAGQGLLRALRAGPPWPTLEVVMNQET